MFKKLIVHDFRILKNVEFELGRYATMLSGWNATGKSTVLALLANGTELKSKYAKTYNDGTFRAEFSEILKGSNRFDVSKSNRLELIWCDENGEEVRSFRTSWQDNGNRFRVIPSGEQNGKKIDSKFDKPVIYLGLSRLFPLGEADTYTYSEQTFDNDEDKFWFYNNYAKILTLQNDIKGAESINISNIKQSKAGITTDKYDWITNSAGQDNLGQILFSVLSFKKLKRDLKENYSGGLLVIDELEASLHPIAQEEVINFLIKEAKQNSFQLVFTTHSLHLIKVFSEKLTGYNNDLTHYFFTKINRNLEIKKNAPYDVVKNDMNMELYKNKKIPKIVVYTEDDEARWFIKKLFKGNARRLEFRKVKIGYSSLIDLMNAEPSFANYIVIFDGDVTPKDTKRIRRNRGNYLVLPSRSGQNESVEKALRGFIFSEDSKEYFSKESKIKDVKIEYFQFHDVSIPNNAKREEYKEWFQTHKKIFNDSKIVEYWMNAYPNETEKFIKKPKETYNQIAKKLNIPEIE